MVEDQLRSASRGDAHPSWAQGPLYGVNWTSVGRGFILGLARSRRDRCPPRLPSGHGCFGHAIKREIQHWIRDDVCAAGVDNA